MNSAFYLIGLAASVLAIAGASAAIAWRRHLRALRQFKALQLLDALARSAEWAEAQARALRFQGATQETDPALQEIGVLQARWFPELAQPAQALFELHLRMARLLRTHQQQRFVDPEASLESGADAAFMALRREHGRIALSMEQQLMRLADTAAGSPQYTLRS